MSALGFEAPGQKRELLWEYFSRFCKEKNPKMIFLKNLSACTLSKTNWCYRKAADSGDTVSPTETIGRHFKERDAEARAAMSERKVKLG